MSLVSCVGVFFVTWWLCLFVVLPFGIQSRHEGDEIIPGADPGAPLDPRVLRTVIATTVLTSVVFAGIYTFFGIYQMSLADLIR